ncbi:hypothetical protein [Pareuzebyella sediminis]|uniref:hypothetical protein n=1 Tax=Pareuzebyella sediminis TaxID=2607998 RepID=UPI001E62E447|nr:hypothetical protein [Pareuzebyella sediminis]
MHWYTYTIVGTNSMTTSRQQNIDRFYDLLNEVTKKFPKRTLDTVSRDRLPEKGVYFFFEENENRENSNFNRVVRIGTHAAIANSKATLYDRLYNHKGSKDLTGNHRGSVFRKLIGFSFLYKDHLDFPHWGDKSKKNDKLIKQSEKPLERIVSTYLHTLPFTVLEVPGPSSKDNDRAMIEENSIALLSNFERSAVDKCSNDWLGKYTKDSKVIRSGLWNNKCVERKEISENYFETIERHLKKMKNWCQHGI